MLQIEQEDGEERKKRQARKVKAKKDGKRWQKDEDTKLKQIHQTACREIEDETGFPALVVQEVLNLYLLQTRFIPRGHAEKQSEWNCQVALKDANVKQAIKEAVEFSTNTNKHGLSSKGGRDHANSSSRKLEVTRSFSLSSQYRLEQLWKTKLEHMASELERTFGSVKGRLLLFLDQNEKEQQKHTNQVATSSSLATQKQFNNENNTVNSINPFDALSTQCSSSFAVSNLSSNLPTKRKINTDNDNPPNNTIEKVNTSKKQKSQIHVEQNKKEQRQSVRASNKALLTLGAEQKRVYNLVLEQGSNIFFTGPAGSGKSYLLECIIDGLRQNGKRVMVCAPTGIAACNIGGMTIHKFAGMGPGDEYKPVEELISKTRIRKAFAQRWRDYDVLVIDEISMVSSIMFDKLENIASAIRQKQNPRGLPFGGMQIVLCGDFLQLPPTTSTLTLTTTTTPSLSDAQCTGGSIRSNQGLHALSSNSSKGTDIPFAFQSTEWKRVLHQQIELKTIYRQKDSGFINLLNDIRVGSVSQESLALLQSRMIGVTENKMSENKSKTINDTGSPGMDNAGRETIVATRLFSHKANVEQENQNQLALLKTEAVEFKAMDTGKSHYRQSLNKDCRAPDRIVLKKGTQVLLTKNLDVENGLANGSRGVVVDFTWDRKRLGQARLPVVKFINGTRRVIDYHPFKIMSGDVTVASRNQVPLDLAWATTIHRSQGMTLDKAHLSLDKCFEYGQCYVALSRIRSLDGLVLEKFDPSKVKAHPAVLRYYQSLQSHISSPEASLKGVVPTVIHSIV